MDAFESATEIVRKLQKAGHTAYFAGGWVRDYLLGHPSTDIDIATDALPQVILDLFPQTHLVGLSFGVVIVFYEGHQFEVASFRKDLSYSNGRKPDQIEFTNAKEDAGRRDFTINGMFYDPIQKEIFDYVGGSEDLKKKVIRCIGNASERFVEDRLRMIRAVRFACRFGFSIDLQTQEAIVECAPTLFPSVAMERVYQEFLKMTHTGHLDHGLIELHRLELLPIIFPSLQDVHLRELKQRVSAFTHYPKDCPLVLHLLALFPEMGLEGWIEICRHLRMSNKEIDLVRLVSEGRTLLQQEHTAELVRWAYFYARSDAQIVLEALAAALPAKKREALLLRHELRQKSLYEAIQRIVQHKPVISADFLKACGISEGRLMGVLLKEAERIAIANNENNPQKVLEALKQTTAWPV